MSKLPAFDQITWIGENRHGYRFAVALSNHRWLGFALGEAEAGERIVFFFPGVADDIIMGCADRLKAIQLTAAVAQDPDQGYGGVDTWFIPPEMLGDPEALRCPECGEIGYHECHEDSDIPY